MAAWQIRSTTELRYGGELLRKGLKECNEQEFQAVKGSGKIDIEVQCLENQFLLSLYLEV